MKYERLTERAGNGKALTKGCETCHDYCFDCEYAENCIDRLAELEDKIEQGLMIELPCKVGDIVWVVCGDISQYKVTEFWYDGVFFNFRGENNEYVEEHKRFRFFDERIGKTVFLTREEAEAKLKELQNK